MHGPASPVEDGLVSIHVHGRQHRHVDIRVGSPGLEQSPSFAEIGQGRDVIAKEAANFTATDQRRRFDRDAGSSSRAWSWQMNAPSRSPVADRI